MQTCTIPHHPPRWSAREDPALFAHTSRPHGALWPVILQIVREGFWLPLHRSFPLHSQCFNLPLQSIATSPQAPLPRSMKPVVGKEMRREVSKGRVCRRSSVLVWHTYQRLTRQHPPAPGSLQMAEMTGEYIKVQYEPTKEHHDSHYSAPFKTSTQKYVRLGSKN